MIPTSLLQVLLIIALYEEQPVRLALRVVCVQVKKPYAFVGNILEWQKPFELTPVMDKE